jgi:maleylacetoacetate isomerase
MMRFHGYFRSSAAYRCRIAFGLKGLTPDFEPVSLRDGRQKSPEYRTVNPQGLVPALEIDGTVLTQSLAIIEWLEETYPDPPLLPDGPAERAKVRAFALAIACDVHPLQNLRVLDYLRKDLSLGEEDVNGWIRRWLGDGLVACEALLAARPASRFCFGDQPGLADICLVPQMASADRFGVDTTRLPRLRAVVGACNDLPAFARASPASQPDAF